MLQHRLILLVGIAALCYTTTNLCQINKKEEYQLWDIILIYLSNKAISWRESVSAALAAASLWRYRVLIRNPLGTEFQSTVQSHSLFRTTILQKYCTVGNMTSFPSITAVLSFLRTTLEQLVHNKVPKNQGCVQLT